MFPSFHRVARTLLLGLFFVLLGLSAPAWVKAERASSGPITSHPRLWLTQNDIPRLRSWAVASNPMYQNGMLVALNAAVSNYNAKFFPVGIPNPSFPDGGSINFELYPVEAYAQFFAFNALIDNNATNRITYAKYARNLLMYGINEAAKGHAVGQPFRDPQFAIYNRANYWGEAWGLTVDWIYDAKDANDNPILTAQDKQTIRDVFMLWANDQLNAYMHPVPVGVTNDPALLGTKIFRDSANNYYSGHGRLMALMALSMDAADDPPLDNSKPYNQLGNSLRSYIDHVIGAWLYQQYAMYEDANTAAQAYGVSPNGLGLAAGGLSVEGSLYGHALGYVEEMLLAFYTAGYTDPATYGPQMNLITSPYWDAVTDGMLHLAAPQSKTIYGWQGPIFEMMSYGDILRFWITPDAFSVHGALGVYDYYTGNTTRLNANRWIAQNLMEGGASKMYNRAGLNVWGNALASDAILYFMLFDPNAPAPTDPRSEMGTYFYAPGAGRVLARTDWTTNAEWFGYRCAWETINHQQGDCNQFELYRNGEWLTREQSGYSFDGISMTPDYHNSLGIQNWCICPGGKPNNIQFYEEEGWLRGGQWTNGQNAGDPVVVTSDNSAYTYAQGISTPLYNRPALFVPENNAMDVLHASRSMIWLKPDRVITYDRATTGHNGFKHYNLSVTALAQVNNKLATVTTPNGQKFFITSLLPANATLTASPAEDWQLVADNEPANFRVVINAPDNPTNVRFLTVMQGADAGASADAATHVTTTGGASFDGAIVNGMLVMFPVNVSPLPTALSYTVPASVSKHIITGLAANASYSVNITPAGGNVQIAIASGGAYVTDNAGVLSFTPGVVPSTATSTSTPTQTLTPTATGTTSATNTATHTATFTRTATGTASATNTATTTATPTGTPHNCVGAPNPAANFSPPNASVIVRPRVKLDWEDVPCASFYKVRVRQDSPKGERVLRKKVFGSRLRLKGLTVGKTYYWRVLTCNASGCTRAPWINFRYAP